MLADGLSLLDGSEITRTIAASEMRGNSFPPSPSADDIFELLIQVGQYAPGIYSYVNSQWVIKYPGNSLLPYDISGSTNGTVRDGDTIATFIASRGFSIQTGFLYCIAACKIAPATDVTFTITKQSASGSQSNLGTIYFAASETVGVYTQVGNGSINIVAGDIIQVVAPNPIDQFISDIAFTLSGSLN